MVATPFTKKPYLPEIRLYKNDGSFFTFDPLDDTFNFNVRRLSFTRPFGGVSGRFTLVLTSENALLSETNDILDEIEEGNEIEIWIGKTSATKEKKYLGVIENITTIESNPHYIDVEITGMDWGSILLAGLRVSGERVQETLADGETRDPEDPNSKLQKLYHELVTNDYWRPTTGTRVTAEDFGLDVDLDHIDVPDINVAQFYANMETIQDKFSELNKIAGTYNFVDENRLLHIHRLGDPLETGMFLFVDNFNNSLVNSWPSGFASFICHSFNWNRTVEEHKARTFGIGGDEIIIDQEQDVITHSETLETNWWAMKFDPIEIDLESIGTHIEKLGTPTVDLGIIVKEDLNNTPMGSTISNQKKGEAAIADAFWAITKIGQDLNTAKSHWIILQSAGPNSSNTYRWYRDNSSDHTNAFSSDGINWTVQDNSFGFAFRTYFRRPVIVTYPQTISSTQKHYVEEVVRKPDITNRALMTGLLQQEGKTLAKKKQVVEFDVYVPDEIPLAGGRCRIVKTGGRTLDAVFSMAGTEFIFETDESNQTGLFYLHITASRFVDFGTV